MGVDDPHIMYLVVRKSLGMSPGKLAGQVGHAVENILCEEEKTLDMDYNERQFRIHNWRHEDSTKVVLGADDNEFEKAKNLPHAFVVIDLGRTELAQGTETVIGFAPMQKSKAPKLLKRLRLL